MPDLDQAVVTSIREFLADVSRTGWQGRELDAASLFAFGPFLKNAAKLIPDPRQIAIGVSAHQPPPRPEGSPMPWDRSLVVWPAPMVNAWSGAVPYIVMEWKVDAEVRPRRVSGPEFLDAERRLENLTGDPRHATTAAYAVHLSFYQPTRAVALVGFRNGIRRELTHAVT